jgi:hypothetical protein
MRKAVLKVLEYRRGSRGVIFFHFGPANGGTQANVERWYGQFQGSKEEKKARSEETKAGTAR